MRGARRLSVLLLMALALASVSCGSATTGQEDGRDVGDDSIEASSVVQRFGAERGMVIVADVLPDKTLCASGEDMTVAVTLVNRDDVEHKSWLAVYLHKLGGDSPWEESPGRVVKSGLDVQLGSREKKTVTVPLRVALEGGSYDLSVAVAVYGPDGKAVGSDRVNFARTISVPGAPGVDSYTDDTPSEERSWDAADSVHVLDTSWQNKTFHARGHHYMVFGSYDGSMYYRSSADGVNWSDGKLFSDLGRQEDRYVLWPSGITLLTAYAGRISSERTSKIRESTINADGTLTLGEWVEMTPDANWDDYNSGALLSDGKFMISYRALTEAASEPSEEEKEGNESEEDLPRAEGMYVRVGRLAGGWVEVPDSPFKLSDATQATVFARVIPLTNGHAYVLLHFPAEQDVSGYFWDGESFGEIEIIQIGTSDRAVAVSSLSDGRVLLVSHVKDASYQYTTREPGQTGAWEPFTTVPNMSALPGWLVLSSSVNGAEAYLFFEDDYQTHHYIRARRFDGAGWTDEELYVAGSDSTTVSRPPAVPYSYDRFITVGFITGETAPYTIEYAYVNAESSR